MLGGPGKAKEILLKSNISPPFMLVSLWLDFNIEVACFQGNIESVINTIQANKITEDSSQAVQGMMIR